MSSLTPHTANGTFVEPQRESSDFPTRAVVQKSGSDFVLASAGEAQGVLVDYQGTGDYELLDLTAEWFLVASGSDYTLSSTGPAIAILVEDDDGNLVIDTDVAQPPAARFVQNMAGDIVLYRSASPELRLLYVGSDYLAYQD